MKYSELSDDELQREFLKIENRYQVLVRVTPPHERNQSPLSDLRRKLNEIIDEFKRRKTSQT